MPHPAERPLRAVVLAALLVSSVALADGWVVVPEDSEGIDEGAKSVAFTLRFGADRTLTDDEVDEQIEAITDALAENHDATLRQ